jgi:RND family efflux transporter MFP subunit
MFGPSTYRSARNLLQISSHASLLLFAAVALTTSGCGDKKNAQQGAAPQAMPVQVQVATSEKIPDTTEYLSQLKSRHSATINPQVEGQITKIFVKSGDRVSAGQPLLEIDPLKQQATVSSQEASRAAAEASMQLAKTNLDRAKRLYEAGVIPKQDYDNAQASYDSSSEQVKALKEQVNQEKVQLNYYRVSAPMTGIVGDIPVRMGDRVTVTTLLTTVDEPGALETYIYVPADRARDLKSGLPVHLLDIEGAVIADTKISFVSPQVDLETQTVLAKALIPNVKATLRVSQQVRAQITWGIHEGPMIPILAVSRINGQFFAFVATNDGKGTVAHQKLLKLGDTVGNN